MARNLMVKMPPQKTDERLAVEYKVSPKTIQHDAKFAEAVDNVGEGARDVRRLPVECGCWRELGQRP